MSKKALVYLQEYQGKSVGHIERVGEADEINNWTHHLRSSGVIGVVNVKDGADEKHLKIESTPDTWTKEGEEPVTVDPQDETWTLVPAYWEVGEDLQEKRKSKMNSIRSLRNTLLSEADIKINILSDDNQDVSAWKEYRKSLRDITEPYKKVDGDWKVSVDNLSAASFPFPSKPN